MARQFSNDSLFLRDINQLFSDVDNEIVMLNTESSEYYGLNEVSSEIWRFIDSPKTISDIAAHLEERYDVDHNICIEETQQFLQETIELGIVKIIPQ